mmetsp:Transcript_128215/g.285692  ORF Transcript_128215/g.285692 Transcript_128215/m.285692 type:complete len:242 (+) Transcript_128215:952-1677(+)
MCTDDSSAASWPSTIAVARCRSAIGFGRRLASSWDVSIKMSVLPATRRRPRQQWGMDAAAWTVMLLSGTPCQGLALAVTSKRRAKNASAGCQAAAATMRLGSGIAPTASRKQDLLAWTSSRVSRTSSPSSTRARGSTSSRPTPASAARSGTVSGTRCNVQSAWTGSRCCSNSTTRHCRAATTLRSRNATLPATSKASSAGRSIMAPLRMLVGLDVVRCGMRGRLLMRCICALGKHLFLLHC